MSPVLRWLQGPPWRASTVVALGLAGIPAADYLLGPQLSLAFFYLLPVGVAAWSFGFGAGAAVAVAAAAGWGVADLAAGREYAHQVGAWWNGGMRLGLLLVLALLVASVRRMLEAERQGAATDALTGIANRRTLLEAVAGEIRRSARTGIPSSVAYLDLDDFKDLNDREGHGAGDEALRRVADELRRACRAGDLAARLGGDEFAVLLVGADRNKAMLVVQRLHASLTAVLTERGWGTGVSVGVACFTGSDAGPEEVLRAADRAMYRAKAAGKGRVSTGE